MTPDALAALPAGHRLILAAGTRRSGSTALYNIARLLLERQGGPLTAGWIEDLAEPVCTTVLVKVHDWQAALAARADVVLTCHRDLREVVRSFAAIGWIRPGQAVFDQIRNVTHHYMQWKPAAAANLAYEAMVRDWRAAVAEVAVALGINAPQAEIDAIAREVSELPVPDVLPDGKRHDVVTLMHRRHRRNAAAQRHDLEDEVHQRFLSWQIEHGYS